jgi:hypothetical protein
MALEGRRSFPANHVQAQHRLLGGGHLFVVLVIQNKNLHACCDAAAEGRGNKRNIRRNQGECAPRPPFSVDRSRLAVALDLAVRSGVMFSLYSLSRSRFRAALPRRGRIHPTSRVHQGCSSDSAA